MLLFEHEKDMCNSKYKVHFEGNYSVKSALILISPKLFRCSPKFTQRNKHTLNLNNYQPSQVALHCYKLMLFCKSNVLNILRFLLQLHIQCDLEWLLCVLESWHKLKLNLILNTTCSLRDRFACADFMFMCLNKDRT